MSALGQSLDGLRQKYTTIVQIDDPKTKSPALRVKITDKAKPNDLLNETAKDDIIDSVIQKTEQSFVKVFSFLDRHINNLKDVI